MPITQHGPSPAWPPPKTIAVRPASLPSALMYRHATPAHSQGLGLSLLTLLVDYVRPEDCVAKAGAVRSPWGKRDSGVLDTDSKSVGAAGFEPAAPRLRRNKTRIAPSPNGRVMDLNCGNPAGRCPGVPGKACTVVPASGSRTNKWLPADGPGHRRSQRNRRYFRMGSSASTSRRATLRRDHVIGIETDALRQSSSGLRYPRRRPVRRLRRVE